MGADGDSAAALLDAAYSHLGYAEGQLLDASRSPCRFTSEDWLDKGEWLSLGEAVGAEKLFFVGNNPVIVFAQQPSKDPEQARRLFQRVWNMARPPLLFMATPGELAVYDLTQGPARDREEWERTVSHPQLPKARTIAEVAVRLQQYRRELVETGSSFTERPLAQEHRADKALVSDLAVVRDELLDNGLPIEHAHALIGRSIFVRYLEDRGILTKDYFLQLASRKKAWRDLLEGPAPAPYVDPKMEERIYVRVLGDKGFAYALFDKLADDFNGDMFPKDKGERTAVTARHLSLLQSFLRGDRDPKNRQLFFFAYKFDVIPIELISSIYEEFYSTARGDQADSGTHYTPPALVEFLLSHVLTPDRLRTNPRVLDPACGSGVFLVEAFRRIVRYHAQARRGQRLTYEQLAGILCNQIAGIDISDGAIRIAAFSLYLAFLNYLEPPDILAQLKVRRRLPNLKYEIRQRRRPKQHFDILLAANTFDVSSAIAPSDSKAFRRFSCRCADIVVGNPPWGSPPSTDTEQRQALQIALRWCDARKLPVGDKEQSQAFIHRAMDLLREGGQAALLVSSGVLFKKHPNSQAFRQKWLSTATLREVINFVHVRDVFFQGETRRSGARSPFVSVVFSQRSPRDPDELFAYWSAKKTAVVDGIQAVVLSKPDLKMLRQQDLIRDDRLWKVYWWGTHRDERLIAAIDQETPLSEASIRETKLQDNDFGRGFEETRTGHAAEQLQGFGELRTRDFERYGPIDLGKLRGPPSKVHRQGNLRIYEGPRLLVKRGITERGRDKGQIIARLAWDPFCFRHSIYGLRLPADSEPEMKVLLGIFWSSLARYYYWLTSASWGTWHHEIRLEELKRMPIRFPDTRGMWDRIIRIVDGLRDAGPTRGAGGLFDCPDKRKTGSQIAELEQDLDIAIYDLYGLSRPERDLVGDMCGLGLDLFYRGSKGDALKPVEFLPAQKRAGRAADLYGKRGEVARGLRDYIRAFLDSWNRELLDGNRELGWHIICPGGRFPMIAVIFPACELGAPQETVGASEQDQWKAVLEILDTAKLVPFGTRRIYVEGLVRAVASTEIMIIRRNEKRLWTASMGREDAEATMVQAMNLPDLTKRQSS